ncbi:hypothetical protein ANO11243_038800 [Dothideomycetidae sp. 11243]|nr:hypothetical protein ANO11243_038800 [fungal sp. No.11243]
MTAAPSYVAVKRKRDEAPIQSLILEERRTKHARINVEYRLESVSQLSNEQPSSGSASIKPPATLPPTNGVPDGNNAKKPCGPRHFELASNGTGKRSADAAGLLPTFVERPVKRAHLSGIPTPESPRTPTLKRPGTRRLPGANTNGAETKILGKGAEPSAGLTAALHAFALEEAALDGDEEQEQEQEPRQKPRVIMQPRRTVRRRRDMGADAPQNGHNSIVPKTETGMTNEDGDYVYDIYIRSAARSIPCDPPPPALQAAFPNPAPPPSSSNLQQPIDPSAPRTPSLLPINPDSTAPRSLLESYTSLSPSAPSEEEVGYLILPSSSSSSYFWTSGSPSHSRRNSRSSSDEDGEGDEDSNAEDHYAADYPEDEVDEDDEMGRGEWRFRHAASDDEDDFRDPGWAGRGGAANADEDGWSDDSLEADRSINPWRRFGGKTD